MTRRKSPSPTKLAGKSAVVTGASRGIGLAIAQALAGEGCNVLISARTQAKLKSAARQITGNGRVVAQPCDVRDRQSVERLFAVAKREFKAVDILINNAGIAHPLITVDKLPIEQWNDVIA